MNTYKAVGAAAVAAYGEGTVELDFTASEEADRLSAGVLELVPRPYRVLTNNYEAGNQDEVVELALLVETEAALLAGGHLERVQPKTTRRKKEDD